MFNILSPEKLLKKLLGDLSENVEAYFLSLRQPTSHKKARKPFAVLLRIPGGEEPADMKEAYWKNI